MAFFFFLTGKEHGAEDQALSAAYIRAAEKR